MLKIFLTSDIHFYHKNVIKYDKRPFNNVDDINEDSFTGHRMKTRTVYCGSILLITEFNTLIGNTDVLLKMKRSFDEIG